MSTYQSTSSEADEARLKLSAASSTTTNKKRARSASQGGQSSQDEQLLSTNKKPTTGATASSSSTQAAAAATGTGADGTVPATPAVSLRKEQNRAAQRAFRDRKERHLQQLENLIQDLKDQQFLLTTQFQREIQQLKSQNQVVVQENQYLREVVFAFESALNYRGDLEVLQDVKQGLYRRHVGRQHQQGNGVAVIAGGEPQEQEQQQQQQQQQGRQPLPPPSPSLSSTRASLSPVLQATTIITLGAIHSTSTTASAIPHIHIDNNCNNSSHSPIPSLTGREATGEGDYFSRGNTNSPSHRVPSASLSPPLQQVSNPSDATVTTETEATPTPYSINREILYRAPASLHISELNNGGGDVSQATVREGLLAAATTASSGGGVMRPTPFFPAGTPLPKVTDYTKHPTVFDELQSSLFPPGALQALVSTNMGSPLDVVNDTKLFDQLGDKSEDSTTATGTSSRSARSKTTATATSTTFTTSNGHAATSSTSSYSTSTAATTTSSTKSTPRTTESWSRTELLQKTHRLQKTFKVLAAGPLRSDPKIDQQIYEIPHDSRIDLVPCPKLRAQMILHQHRYNIDEVFQLLVDKAICHGSPLEPSHWELPDEFFENYGFLVGVDLEHQRRKVWPRPLPPDMM
ncbi:hypothetical protein BGX24_006207 [Mortierella sp. AD032]|nr:hypothetical protein BGX24_006207 [Mortierella sp. AD032]